MKSFQKKKKARKKEKKDGRSTSETGGAKFQCTESDVGHDRTDSICRQDAPCGPGPVKEDVFHSDLMRWNILKRWKYEMTCPNGQRHGGTTR